MALQSHECASAFFSFHSAHTTPLYASRHSKTLLLHNYCPAVAAQTHIPNVPIIYEDNKKLLFPILRKHFLSNRLLWKKGCVLWWLLCGFLDIRKNHPHYQSNCRTIAQLKLPLAGQKRILEAKTQNWKPLYQQMLWQINDHHMHSRPCYNGPHCFYSLDGQFYHLLQFTGPSPKCLDRQDCCTTATPPLLLPCAFL